MGGEDGALLVRPADAASLAGGILRALADPKGARSRAVVARRRFLSNYTIDRVARRMLEFFERALADSGREQKGNGDLHRPAHKRGLA
jgi:glycosyltransferase involved in cell wall biosynthesis